MNKLLIAVAAIAVSLVSFANAHASVDTQEIINDVFSRTGLTKIDVDQSQSQHQSNSNTIEITNTNNNANSNSQSQAQNIDAAGDNCDEDGDGGAAAAAGGSAVAGGTGDEGGAAASSSAAAAAGDDASASASGSASAGNGAAASSAAAASAGGSSEAKVKVAKADKVSTSGTLPESGIELMIPALGSLGIGSVSALALRARKRLSFIKSNL